MVIRHLELHTFSFVADDDPVSEKQYIEITQVTKAIARNSPVASTSSEPNESLL
jgi:hypothetical protein